MKRCISLIIALVMIAMSLSIFASCSSDPIVGTWHSISVMDRSTYEETIYKEHILHIKSNGTFDICYSSNGSIIKEGTWEKTGDNSYDIEGWDATITDDNELMVMLSSSFEWFSK